MKISFYMLLFLSMFVYAKDNPFDNNTDKTNTEFVNTSPFQRQDFNFNSQARILKNITITYINLDGTEEQISMDINKNINWHDTYSFIKTKTPNATPILDVSVTVPQEKNTKTEENNTTINIETPLYTGSIYNFLSLSFYNNKINIKTEDKMLRNLSIGDPTKIIIDFAKKQNFNTKTLQVNTAHVKKVVFGSHKGYYRLVIYLDGKYDYQYSKNENLHTFNFR
ncbi:AMIN domain-containing protein [Campylobacter peloridis]|uniref:AMIN domain-containing protein n=1 Tax=Campylobacter peloridis TaxID=488546 RepID=A0ABX6U018_9BACT|nr:AMIN domain-containing protein [Campylobacter peloridis]AJC84025.1 putative periplasmic protein (AMIN domain) [Campylobacter peloridis LMG 23910]QOQ89614.1 AMIN domain-containing protein [Campylobacter peloridis]